MRIYTVRVVAEDWVDIEASDEEEALEEAREQVCFTDSDYSCEVMAVSKFEVPTKD